MHRACTNHPDNFCYVCVFFFVKSQRRTITNQLKNIYELYFGCPLGDQDKSWAPHVICTSCSSGLRDWLNKRKLSMPFAIPMVWSKELSRSARRSFRRMILSCKVFRSVKNQKNIQFTQYYNVI